MIFILKVRERKDRLGEREPYKREIEIERETERHRERESERKRDKIGEIGPDKRERERD